MTIDKATLSLAREWACNIDDPDWSVPQGHIDAAAEVIASLPDEIIDAEKVRELVDSWRGAGDMVFPGGGTGVPLSVVLRDLEALLPAPDPRVEVRMGQWAMHPEHGKVLILSDVPSPSDEVVVAYKDEKEKDRGHGFVSALVKHSDLLPLPEDEDDAESKFDPAYMYCDKNGDFWQYRDGLWKFATPWNLDFWMGSYNTPSDDYAPYARVEKEVTNE